MVAFLGLIIEYFVRKNVSRRTRRRRQRTRIKKKNKKTKTEIDR